MLDTLIPTRFLTTLAHLLFVIMIFSSKVRAFQPPPRERGKRAFAERAAVGISQDNNIKVALPMEHEQGEFDKMDTECAARAAPPARAYSPALTRLPGSAAGCPSRSTSRSDFWGWRCSGCWAASRSSGRASACSTS